MTITLSINGTKVELDCRPHESLRAVLRRAGYHSVRFGSETGETGAAAVLVDGALITSDLMLAAQADGHDIETVAGLSSPGHLHPIQKAFIETGAIQSGYSTPAMILAAKAPRAQKKKTVLLGRSRDAGSQMLGAYCLRTIKKWDSPKRFESGQPSSL